MNRSSHSTNHNTHTNPYCYYYPLVFWTKEDIAPAPPSIGANIPLTYFAPAPSAVQKELVDPLQLLRSHTNSNP